MHMKKAPTLWLQLFLCGVVQWGGASYHIISDNCHVFSLKYIFFRQQYKQNLLTYIHTVMHVGIAGI